MHRLREIAGTLLLSASVSVSFGAQAQGTPARMAKATAHGAAAQAAQAAEIARRFVELRSASTGG
jgi:hypothetical protein